MRRKPGALTEHESHVIRIAWWVSFLATIAIVTILGMVRSAQAATLSLGDPGAALAALPFETAAEEPEDEGEDAAEDEDEREAEGCDEEDEEECREDAGSCILRSASATVSVAKTSDRVRLVLHYTALSPAVVSVEYGLRGSRGALRMNTETHRFSRRGIFRDTQKLTDTEMAKVKGAREFDVRLHAINTPRSCHKLFDRDLTARHPSANGITWTAENPSR